MKHLFWVATVLVSAAPAWAQEPAIAPSTVNIPGQIAAAGTGEATLTPDRARVFVGVQTRSSTAAVAAADNARKQRGIIDTLRALGLSSEQLTTMNYAVMPEMQYDPSGRESKVVGYVVSNTVRADVRKLDDVARVVDAALAQGANQITNLQFYASNSDDARRMALSQAVSRARSDAEIMARAAGGSLGALLELTTGVSNPRPLEMDLRAARPMAAVATPIEPGQETIQVTVTGRWLFNPQNK